MTCETGNCEIPQKPKRIHGAPIPEWEKLGLLEHSPQPGDGLQIGDTGVYSNDYGVEFEEEVIGFSVPDPGFRNGAYIHLKTAGHSCDGSAWWFPHRADEFRKN